MEARTGRRTVSTGTGVDAAPELTVPVMGMTCTSCERRVTKALRAVPGVRSVRVSATRGVATVRGDAPLDRDLLHAAIRSAGYEPGTAPWLTRDGSVWRTVLVATLAVGAFATTLTLLGPADLTSGLSDPGRGGLLLVLVLGVTAGVSTCMAMVGGLVLGLSASHAATLAARGRTGLPFMTRMRPQLAFNAGRVIGFGVLGALLGALGSTMSLPTRVTGVLLLVVAAVMFLLGIRLTGVSPRVAAWSPRLPAGLGRVLGIEAAAEADYSHWRTALVGAATFFLPCGFTQAAQVYALSTASPLAAGGIMATFALGTTPGLLALASVPEVTTGRRQATVLRVVGVLVLAFALLNVSSGLNLLGLSRGSGQRQRRAHGIRERHRHRRGADRAHDADPEGLRARGHRALCRHADDVAHRRHLEVRLQRVAASARPGRQGQPGRGSEHRAAAGAGGRHGALHLRDGHVLGQPRRRRPTGGVRGR